MTLAEELALDTAAAIGGYDATFTWTPPDADAALTIPCVRRDSPNAREILDAGGEVDTGIFSLTVAKSATLANGDPAFAGGVYPSEGDLINGTAAQIQFINGKKDPSSVRLTLLCSSPDKPRA